MGLKFNREHAIKEVIKTYRDSGAIVNRAFAEQMVDAILDGFPKKWISLGEGIPNSEGCPHDLKEYKGIVQNYVYCTICDEKFP
jgi:hypothetical protein